jgi:hypothetical protein
VCIYSEKYFLQPQGHTNQELQKGATLQNKHTPQLRNNKETNKTKNTTEFLPEGHRPIQQDTATKYQIHTGK